MTSGPLDLLSGVLYPFRALGVIGRTPRLWKFIVIPILLNIMVGITLYVGLLVAGLRWIDSVVAGLPEMATFLAVVLQVLLIVVLFIGLGYVLVRFGVVLGSPWYGQLAEKLERERLADVPPAPALSLGTVAFDIWRALLFEGKKLAFVLPITLALLALNLIPVAGTILFAAGSIVLGATVTCLDFFDAPLERRRLRFRAKLGVVRRSLPASAGFGLACLGLVSIPFISLLAIPVCVTAGALFFCERIAEQR